MKRRTKPTLTRLAAAKHERRWQEVLTESVNRARMLCSGSEDPRLSKECRQEGASTRSLDDRTFFHLLKRLVSLTDTDYIALVQSASYRRRLRGVRLETPNQV